MGKYFKAFAERMGPIGFGLGVSLGLLGALVPLVGVTRNGDGIVLGLVLGAVVGAFVFFLVGTAIIAAVTVLRMLASAWFSGPEQP